MCRGDHDGTWRIGWLEHSKNGSRWELANTPIEHLENYLYSLLDLWGPDRIFFLRGWLVHLDLNPCFSTSQAVIFTFLPICSYQPGATEVIYGGQTSSRPKEPFIWSCMEHMEHGEVDVSLHSDVDHATKNNNAEYVMSTTVIEHRKNNHRIQRVQELSLVKVHRPLPQGGYGRPSWSVWIFGFGMLHSRWGILQTLLFEFNMVHLENDGFQEEESSKSFKAAIFRWTTIP